MVSRMVVRTARGRRGIAFPLVAALLAACGGTGEPETPAALEPEAVSAPEEVEPEPEDDVEQQQAAETEEQEPTTGPAQHRPPDDLDLDCGEVAGASPGAVLAFPDGDGTGTLGTSPVTVEFVGCSDTFEANVVYEAFHGTDRRPTVTGFTMGGTLGDWAEFRFEETFWTPGEWRVEIVEEDAEDGERRVYDEVVFSIDPS